MRWPRALRDGPLILEDATPQALGVLRILVFGLWFFHVATIHLEDVAALPFEVLERHGVLSAIPDAAWEWLWTPAVLSWLRYTLLFGLLWSALGLAPFRAVAIPTTALITLYDGMAKSFGHVNHSTIALLFAAMILSAFPSADAVSLRRLRPLREPPSVYRAPLVMVAVLITVCYAFIGIYRIDDGGFSVFASDALKHWFLVRGYEPTVTGFRFGIFVAEHPPLLALFKFGFFVTGMLEILSPLALLYRPLRAVWVATMVPFHLLSLFTMNIFFWQNALLILYLFTPAYRFFAPRRSEPGREPILFFDGECGLCNRFARFFLARDRASVFRLAPLQGETARALLPADARAADPDSIVLLDERGVRERSDAVLVAFARLGGLWALIAPCARLVPRPVRDAVYDFVARRRIAWFGRVESCSLVPPAWRERLLP